MANIDLQNLVSSSPHVRTPVEVIPDRHMFVYDFLGSDLQLLNTRVIPPAAKKMILRDALRGLADLHEKSIYHTGSSPIYYPVSECDFVH